MGDALFTTPALAVLRARYPEARMDVLVGERASAILKGNPSIDRLIVRPPHGGSGRAVALARALRAGRYDAVVLFQSTLSNALLTFAAGVPLRIGFAQEGCAPLLTAVVPPRQAREHDVDAYLRLANALGSPGKSAASLEPPLAPSYLTVALTDADREFADHFFLTHELVPPVVGLVLGATRPQKRWPEANFARLADRLWNEAGMSAVLLGGPEEREAAQRVMAQARSAPIISAVGVTTEKQLAALIARLRVVVSGDSGPLHVATAMGTPVVALFGSTDPAVTGPWKPAGGDAVSLAPPALVLYDALDCAPCRKAPTCEGRYDCMVSLTQDRVFDAIRALEAGQTSTPTVFKQGRRLSLPVLPMLPTAPPVVADPAPVSPVRSVLVLTKHRFMGDTIVAVPLLRAVRRAFPDARITLLTGAEAATALQNCPYDIHLLPNDRKTRDRTTIASARLSFSLIRRMVALRLHHRPDLCLVADRSFRAAVAARLCGGRVRAGFDTERRGALLTHPIPYDNDRSEAECCLDILRTVAPEPMGSPPYDPVPELWLTDAERARGAVILAENGGDQHLPCPPLLIGFQPGASTGDRKQWPPERFAAVADHWAKHGNVRIVLLGYGPAEQEASLKMRQALGSAAHVVIDLTSKTQLRETMGVLAHLTLFVGNDTGVSHIAAALHVPTVTLFGPTPARKWGSVGVCNRVIAAANDDMSAISVDEVTHATVGVAA